MMAYLYVFLISMLPVIELRGALIYSKAIHLNDFLATVIAILGNIIVIPIIFIFARKVLEYGANTKMFGKFFRYFIKKGHNVGQKLLKNPKGVYIALMLFVAIPIPGTGAWTGTLGASFLDIDMKKSFYAVVLGVIFSSIIMNVLTFIGFNIFR